MSDKARVCLVDGTFELFRAYYAGSGEKGAALGGDEALVRLGRSLLALTRGARAFSHVAVAFDTVIESFRNDLFAGYKTGEGIEPGLMSLFAPAEELIRALGFCVLSMREFEADDAIASLAHRLKGDPQFDPVVIASPDKDLMQCVLGERVVLWDRIRNTTYSEAKVIEKMGVPPISIPDYLALVGDTADGIPGLPRWGAKSAAKVLARYGHLENIPRNETELALLVRGAAGLLESLRGGEEDLLLYRRLATLRLDAANGLAVSALEYRGIREDEVDVFFRARSPSNACERLLASASPRNSLD